MREGIEHDPQSPVTTIYFLLAQFGYALRSAYCVVLPDFYAF